MYRFFWAVGIASQVIAIGTLTFYPWGVHSAFAGALIIASTVSVVGAEIIAGIERARKTIAGEIWESRQQNTGAPDTQRIPARWRT